MIPVAISLARPDHEPPPESRCAAFSETVPLRGVALSSRAPLAGKVAQVMAELKFETVGCPHCSACPATGQARTIAADRRRVTVTWHLPSCPHYAADRVLAGKED